MAAALSVFAICFALRALIQRLGVHQMSPFALFAPAIVLAPLLGGALGGVSVILLSTVSGAIFFLPRTPSSGLLLASYFVSVAIVVAVVAVLELALQRLVEERERSDQLLREVQHRIANNFQMLSAVLRLHQSRSPDESGRLALRDAGRRVETMGQLHRRLCDEGEDALHVRQHLRGLCLEVIGAAGTGQIEWRVEAPEELQLPADRMLTLSLIVSEVIMNALKYAFSPGARGELQIDVSEECRDVRVVVSDNGVGMIADQGRGGLGTTIIESLAKQLHGRAEWRSNSGTTFELRFPRERK